MNPETLSAALRTGGAALAAACVWFWGGADVWLACLVCFIVLDYASGVTAAFITKTLSSRTGAMGILKKVLLLCVVGLAHRLDLALGCAGALRSAVVGFYVANEGISVLENAGRCGVPVPKKLLSALEQLQGNPSEEAK